MGLNKLIEAIAIIVIFAESTGQLPRLIREIQIAQLHLLKASQSTSWGQALLLPQTQK